MYFTRKQVSQPVIEPLQVADLKLQLYKTASETDQDALLDSMITAARIQVENNTNRQLISAQWDVFLDAFPGYWDRRLDRADYPEWGDQNEIQIPLGNLISIDSFAYTDTSGVTTSWTVSGTNLLLNGAVQAHIDTAAEPGKIVLAYAQVWPTVVLKTSNPIAIRFTCGYADAGAVPEPLKHAIRMLVAHWYENRETTTVGTLMQSGETLFAYNALIANYRLHAF